jgi:hypothetical protein
MVRRALRIIVTVVLFLGVVAGEGVIHFLDHEAGLRVLVAWAICDDFGNRAMLLIQDCLVFHHYSAK